MVEFNSGGNLSEQKGGKLSERYSLKEISEFDLQMMMISPNLSSD